MDNIARELGLSTKHIHPTASPSLFAVIVHTSWLRKWLKNVEIDNCTNNLNFSLQPGESVQYPWRKIFIKVFIHVYITRLYPVSCYLTII